MGTLDRFKFTSIAWDGDKEPHKFQDFVLRYDDVVRSLQHGRRIVEFIDFKLDRAAKSVLTVPSYLARDDDFAPPEELTNPYHTEHKAAMAADDYDDIQHLLGDSPDAGNGDEDDANEDDVKSQAGSVTGTSTRFELRTGRNYYTFLNSKERALDAWLFSTLRQSVKGTKSTLLNSVQSPSYIQAMIVLHQHMDLARNTRKTAAMDAIEKLEYKQNPQKFQVQAVEAISEVLNSGVTIMDFCFMALMKAFKGKSKQTQFQIAKDINDQSLTESSPFFDLIQGYCSDLAAVGDGVKESSSNYTDGDKVCSWDSRNSTAAPAGVHKHGSR